eukprot:jgi/Chrzof1/14225/Cz08g30070.t1
MTQVEARSALAKVGIKRPLPSAGHHETEPVKAFKVNHSPDVPVDAPSALDVQQLISNLQNSKRELGVLLHEPSNAGSSRLLADISSTIQDISLAIESDQE